MEDQNKNKQCINIKNSYIQKIEIGLMINIIVFQKEKCNLNFLILYFRILIYILVNKK